jgi:hypothetical protein
MPLISFEQLPDDARVWIFGSSDLLDSTTTQQLLRDVDAWLAEWQAHGHSLTSAREWRDDRFLVVGVDQSVAGASGCSIDALYRIMQGVERVSGTSLLAGGRVFYRLPSGTIECVDRVTFASRARSSEIDSATHVFDTTLTTAGNYRTAFERPMAGSWHEQLVSI